MPTTRPPCLSSITWRDIFERDTEIARDAGHHRVGMAERDHARAEHIAILVCQPLTIAEQMRPGAAARL